MGLPFMPCGVDGWNGLLLPMVPPCGWDFMYSDRNLAQIEATATATRSSLHFVIPNYNPAQPTTLPALRDFVNDPLDNADSIESSACLSIAEVAST